jgi:hypothetical protein
MRTKLRFVLFVLVAGLPVAGMAQRAPPNQPYENSVIERLRILSAQLGSRDNDPIDRQRHLTELTDQFRGVVDDYIRNALRPREGSKSVQDRVRMLLADQRPHPDYADLPFAREAGLRAGHSLVVAYTIVRPPHFDLATIRGYRADGDRFDLIATTGDDFEDYSMFKVELPSPLPGEMWLLAWGQAHTFNGAKIRFRVHAFDGASFRTIWSPEDMLSAKINLTKTGFVIDHHVRQPPYDIRDEYVLTADGVFKAN